MLGFEGDGLALVEELLRPGIRDAFLEDLHGGTGVGLFFDSGQQGLTVLP